MTEKQELRARMKALEKEFLSAADEAAESARIFSSVENMPEFKAASCVLLYMSIPGEVLTDEVVRRWSLDHRVVIPLVVGDSLVLKEYDLALLRPGYKGILEPSDEAVTVSPEEIDLAIVPGVAFSYQEGPDGVRRHYRMGRGKGFYDRLLPRLRCLLVGVCYPFRFIDHVPVDEWDRPLDAVAR